MSHRSLVFLLVFAATSTADPVAAADEPRPRLVVLTDIGGDPDDTQSLVRLLPYANEFEIEALIASASGTPGELKQAVTKPEAIRAVVEAYGKVRDNLVLHAEGYPTAESLAARITSGNPQRGRGTIGAEHDTDGSRRLIAIVDRDDPRPVNVAVWGGQTDLAQALWRVRNDRGPDGLRPFVAKLRVHDIADQDGIQPWIHDNFPDLFYVLNKAPAGRDKRESAFRGMYLGGDESLTSRAWIDEHVRTGHGPLGALYPPKTWTAPNPHAALKEGDTPSWFACLPNGLGDAAHPEWGGWGGRFVRDDQHPYFRDASDTVDGTTSARATVWRWRPAFQNEFAARMDWCTRPRDEANHAPRAIVDGDDTRAVLLRAIPVGGSVSLDASRSTDPDGDALSYRWWIYDEASTSLGPVRIDDADSSKATIDVPASEKVGTAIHVVLETTDDGDPPLTVYRRVIVNVAP